MSNDLMTTAFIGFGEVNSPRAIIESKCRKALEEVRSLGIKTTATAIVTDDPGGHDVKRALSDLKKADFDFLMVCIAGWIPAHAVIGITHEFRHKPMILWGLAGDMDNEDGTGHIVTTAAQAGTTALRKVFTDLGYKYKYIYSIIGEASPLEKIGAFARAATAIRHMTSTRIGMMGFRDMKLYNTLYEGLSLKALLGTDVEFFEMLEVVQAAGRVDQQEVNKVLDKIRSQWDFVKPVDTDFLKKGIAYYLAIKKIAEDNQFNAVSLKDVDGMKKLILFPPALIFMLLADEMGLCTIPENDAMGSVTQLVLKYITGQCAAYFEFYEFFRDSVLVGVPDYVPAEVVEGKVKVTRAAFGGISGGLLNISTVKTGRLTMARLSNVADQYTMHICTGEGRLRSWEEAGWDRPAPQLPSLEIFLDTPVDDFARQVSGQHYIIVYGDHREALSDFCYLKNINIV
jgi:L-fucose isomerase-like protein